MLGALGPALRRGLALLGGGGALLGPGLLLLAAAALLAAARRRQGGGRGWWRRRRAATPGPGGAGGGSGRAEPRCRRPGCARCAAAARELQRRVLAARAGPAAALGPRSVASWGSSTWRAAWWDLEELVRAGGLSRGSSSDGAAAAPGDGCSGHRCPFCPPPRGRAAPPPPSPPRARAPGARPPGAPPSLRSHLARKGLEIWLGALPGPVRRSQQRAARRQGRPGLPKPIGPGQARPLARRRLCPSLQGKADAVAANVLQKRLRGLWGVPNPTEESLARLVPCPPPLLAPLDPETPWECEAPGRPPAPSRAPPAPASSAGGRLAGSCPERPGSGGEGLPAGVCSCVERAPGSVTRDSLLCRHGGPPRSAEEPRGLRGRGSAAPSPEPPGLVDGAAAPAGPAVADVDVEADLTAPGSRVADAEDGSQPGAAGCAAAVPKLELSRDVRSKLWVHTVRKCLETRLRIFPAAVRRSLETPQPAPPRLPPDGAGGPDVQPEKPAQPRCGASPGARQPRSRPVPVHIAVPEALFLPEEQREALELHVRAKRLQRRRDLLSPSPGPALPSPPGTQGGHAVPGTGSLPGALGGAGDEAAATSEAPGKRQTPPKPWAPATAVVSPVLVPAATSLARGDAAAAVPFLEKMRASEEAVSRLETRAGQRGCSPPASVATLRWSRRRILRALEAGLQEMAQSRSRRDGTEAPGLQPSPSPPLLPGAQPRIAERPMGAPNPAPGEPAPQGLPLARLQVSAPWLERHMVQRALGTFLLPPCVRDSQAAHEATRARRVCGCRAAAHGRPRGMAAPRSLQQCPRPGCQEPAEPPCPAQPRIPAPIPAEKGPAGLRPTTEPPQCQGSEGQSRSPPRCAPLPRMAEPWALLAPHRPPRPCRPPPPAEERGRGSTAAWHLGHCSSLPEPHGHVARSVPPPGSAPSMGACSRQPGPRTPGGAAGSPTEQRPQEPCAAVGTILLRLLRGLVPWASGRDRAAPRSPTAGPGHKPGAPGPQELCGKSEARREPRHGEAAAGRPSSDHAPRLRRRRRGAAPRARQSPWGGSQARARSADSRSRLAAAIPLEASTSTEGTTGSWGPHEGVGAPRHDLKQQAPVAGVAQLPGACSRDVPGQRRRCSLRRRPPRRVGAGQLGGQRPASPRSCQSSRAQSWSTHKHVSFKGTRAHGSVPQAMPDQAALPRCTFEPSSGEDTSSRGSSASLEHCGTRATGHACPCQLHQACSCSAQGAAPGLRRDSPRSVREGVCSRQRKLSPSLQSSSTEHSCHPASRERQCQAL